MNMLTVTLDPTDLYEDARLTAALNDFGRELATLTSAMAPSRRAILKCSVSLQGDGRGPARVFRLSFSESQQPDVAAWDVKVYSGEGADDHYRREVANVLACLARLDKDVFSVHIEPLGLAHGHWGIAYLDADSAAGEPMISLADWIVSAPADTIITSIVSIQRILENAIGALHGIHETTIRSWDEEHTYFTRRWLPHFVFNTPTVIVDAEMLFATVDGVSPKKVPEVSPTPDLLDASFLPAIERTYRTTALRISSGSSHAAILSDYPLRVAITNADFDFSQALGDYVVVSWRGDGREVTSLYSAGRRLIDSAGCLSPLDVHDFIISETEAQSWLRSRVTRLAGAHTDLHAGNIRVNAVGALTKCKIIDLSDLGAAAFHADLTRLEMSLWLETAPRLEATYEDALALLAIIDTLVASDGTDLAFPPPMLKYRPLAAVIVAIRRAALASAGIHGLSAAATNDDYHITLALTSQDGLKWAFRKITDGVTGVTARYVAASALALAHSCKRRLHPLSAEAVDQIQADQVALAAAGDDFGSGETEPEAALNTPVSAHTVTLPFPPAMPIQAAEGLGRRSVGELWNAATHRPPYGSVVGQTLRDYFFTERATLASESLLPIQAQMLERLPFFNSRNCLIAGPTSCGKTFAADLIAVSEGFVRERPSIYIAPTRALAQARHEALKSLVPEGFRERIIVSTGEDYEDDSRLFRGEFNIATMVYEKANVLFASDAFPIAELGALIIDELHMIEDLHRGVIVELLISKVNAARRQMTAEDQRRHDVPRLVLISTEKTIASPDVTEWLNDGTFGPPETYFVDARPVPVDHYLVLPSKTAAFDTVFVTRLTGAQDFHIGEAEYRRIDQAVSQRISSGRWKGMKRAGALSLARPEVQESHNLAFSVITALMERAGIDDNFRILAFGPSKSRLIGLAERLRKFRRRFKREYGPPLAVIEALRNAEPTHALRVLSTLVHSGVYLHNADIDRSVRRAIEHRFEVKGSEVGVEVLLATSTLSYGVNLAVDAVVLIQPDFPFRARNGDIDVKPLSIHELQNMLGRAGRYGKSYGGSAYITCSLYGLEPMKDVVEHYYHVGAEDEPAALQSRLMAKEDLLVAGRVNSRPGKASAGSPAGSAGGFSYPFVRAVLDVLRQVDAGYSSRAVGVRPPGVEDVVEFLGHTLFAATELGKRSVRLMEAAVSRVLAACAEQPVKIVERVTFDDEDEARYRLTPLGGGVIDTGTELSTLVPMLTWVRFLRDPEFQRGRGIDVAAVSGDGSGVPPELFMFGLFLVPEVWRTAREFAPESRGVVELGNEVLIDLNRRDVRRLLAVELEALGILRPDGAIKKLDNFIASKAAPALGGQVAYENAHSEIAYRIFVAACRWVQGRAIEDVEALALSDVLAAKGLVDRIVPTVERMSWLAIALYRCINESAKGLSGVQVESEYERPLLLLARRLRHGCVAEGLPLINRPQSALRRHHVAALVTHDLTVDRLLSYKSRESLQLLKNTLEPLGVRQKELVGLTWDIVDFALRREEDLARVMSQGPADGGGREELRMYWRDLSSAMFGLLRRGEDRSSDIVRVLERSIRLLHGSEGQRKDAEGSAVARLVVREDALEIVSRHGEPLFRVGLVFVRPEVERKERELPPSIRITSDALANAASALAKHDNAIVVGLPWFLPNAVRELSDGLRPQLGSRRSLLMTPSCLLSIVSLVQRRLLALEDLRDGFLKTFNHPINVVSVSDLPVKFALPQLPSTLRESMMNHYQVTHRRRNA